MYQCENGYEIEEDYSPPLRCHFQGKYDYPNCKSCPYYNHEYDLINQAIESAKCRIYRLKQNEGSTLAHQKKAKNQQDLIKTLNEASVSYYKYDNPTMTDKQYDDLYDKLSDLEKETEIIMSDSPTQKVQGETIEYFEKVQHGKPI